MSLAAAAPPAPVTGGPPYPRQLLRRGRMTHQELVVTPSQLLAYSAEPPAKIATRGGVIPVLPLHVVEQGGFHYRIKPQGFSQSFMVRPHRDTTRC